MKTLGKVSVILILIGLLGLTIYLWYQNRILRDNQQLQVLTEYKTDTIFIEKEFKPEPSYPEQVKEKEILVYENQGDDSITFASYTDVKKRFSNQDSLFQILLEESKLQLNLVNPSTGIYSSRIFPINLNDYTYNWYQGTLTAEKRKRLSLKPYAYAKYRIFNNLLDLGTGISFKTKNLDYNLGINAFHYPSFKKGIGFDFEVGIKYNF